MTFTSYYVIVYDTYITYYYMMIYEKKNLVNKNIFYLFLDITLKTLKGLDQKDYLITFVLF